MKSITLLLLFASSLCFVSMSIAEEMPQRVEKSLQEILERPEFHARKAQRSPIEEMWMRFVNEVRSHLSNFLNQFRLEQADISEDSYFARFLIWLAEIVESVLSVVKVLAKVFFGILVLYLGFRLYQTLRKHLPLFRLNRSAESEISLSSISSVNVHHSVEELLAQGEVFLAFLAIRKKIRNELLQKNALPRTLTDRELRRALATPSTLFSTIVDLFEAQVFAGKKLSTQELQGVCDSYMKGVKQ